MDTRLLGKDAFAAARAFVESQARPLEAARFHALFDDGPDSAVLAALTAYQNDDGGFGRALEPDLRAEESSALCTSIAFQILRSVGAPADHPLVAGGIEFLLRSLDEERMQWRIIPRSATESPHARWWNHTSDEGLYRSFSPNPTVEILGYFYDYRELVAGDLVARVRDRIFGHLDEAAALEMHELRCYLRLLRTQRLASESRDRLLEKLVPLIEKTVTADPAQLTEYGLHPLDVVDEPASPFLSGREAAVGANLDYLITSQGADGSWSPGWSWGELYPEEWKRARREWSGILTFDSLTMLNPFGRIEGRA